MNNETINHAPDRERFSKELWEYALVDQIDVRNAFEHDNGITLATTFDDCTIVTSAHVEEGDHTHSGSRGVRTFIFEGQGTRVHRSVLDELVIGGGSVIDRAVIHGSARVSDGGSVKITNTTFA